MASRAFAAREWLVAIGEQEAGLVAAMGIVALTAGAGLHAEFAVRLADRRRAQVMARFAAPDESDGASRISHAVRLVAGGAAILDRRVHGSGRE